MVKVNGGATVAPATPPGTDATLARWRAVEASILAGRVEGAPLVRPLLATLAARANGFLLGPPGTGKSMLVESLLSHIDGAAGFRTLMTRFSEPGELFGPVSLSALQADKYERVIAGYLPTAHIAFLDEIFKANSAILNSLLTLVNERIFRNGTATLRAPLLSLFGASNELPGGDELGALYDRFAVRLFVAPVSENGFRTLLDERLAAPSARMSLADVEAGIRAARAVTIPASVLDTVAAMRRDGKTQGIQASDRRWLAALALVRASAWLDGRTVASVADLSILACVLWDNPDQRRKVEDFVLSYSAPMRRKALEMLDAAREQRAALENASDDTARLEASRKLRSLGEEVAVLVANAGGAADDVMRDAAAKIAAWRGEARRMLTDKLA